VREVAWNGGGGMEHGNGVYICAFSASVASGARGRVVGFLYQNDQISSVFYASALELLLTSSSCDGLSSTEARDALRRAFISKTGRTNKRS